MRRPPFIFGLVACAVLGAFSQLHASSTPTMEWEQLCDASELICEVEILDRTAVDLGNGRIETRYTLGAILPMKGAMSSAHQIRLPGGAVGARGQVVPGLPTFEVGDRVFLFLTEEGEFNWRVPVGLSAGAFRVQYDAQGEAVVSPFGPVGHSASESCGQAGCAHAGLNVQAQPYDQFVTRIEHILAR